MFVAETSLIENMMSEAPMAVVFRRTSVTTEVAPTARIPTAIAISINEKKLFLKAFITHILCKQLKDENKKR